MPCDARGRSAQFREPLPQPLAIFARLGETVDVIDPHAVDHAFRDTAGRSAHATPRTLPAARRARRRASLTSKKRRQLTSSAAVRHHASRKCWRSSSRCRRSRPCGDRRAHARRASRRSRPCRLRRDELAQRVARFGGARLIGGLRRQAVEALASALDRRARLQDRRVIDRAHRKRVRVVPITKRPSSAAKRSAMLAAPQVPRRTARRETARAPCRAARDRANASRRRNSAHTRCAGPIRGCRATTRSRAADAHMIRHDVDDQPHVVRAQLVDEALAAPASPPQFGVDLRVVDGVVAVRRAGSSPS